MLLRPDPLPQAAGAAAEGGGAAKVAKALGSGKGGSGRVGLMKGKLFDSYIILLIFLNYVKVVPAPLSKSLAASAAPIPPPRCWLGPRLTRSKPGGAGGEGSTR